MRSPISVLPITALSLLLTTAFAIPTPEAPAANDDRFTLYKLPTPLTGPCDLVQGPDGALWGQGLLLNTIFRIDPSTSEIDSYAIPSTTPLSNTTTPLPGILKEITDRTALSCAIRAGSDGNLYAGNGVRNQLVRINPTSKEIKVFEIPPANPLGDLLFFNDLYSGPDGVYVTSTTANTFSFFRFATEEFTTYEVPTPLALPLGMYVASNGIVYVAELLGNKILTFDPKTKVMDEYPLPELAQFPAVIRAEKDGYVYFSLFEGNGIGRINMETHAIELFHTNQIGGLGAEDTIDDRGGVWLSSFTADVLARLDTDSLEYSYVPLPGTFAQTGLSGILGDIPPYLDVAINYGPGEAIWFTSLFTNQVGKYDIRGLYG